MSKGVALRGKLAFAGRMRRCLVAGLACVSLALTLVSAAPVGATDATFASHPRIWLDPAAMAILHKKVASDAPSWRKLKARCDQFLGGRVTWPEGNAYPNDGSIGEGYQGSGYFSPLIEVGLCYQMARDAGLASAASYAKKGVAILTKMSAPAGTTHAVDPLRDDGYGIRFYGTGLGIGFDWFYNALSPTIRERVVTAYNRWVDRYENGGFENDFPVGNYFAGYYAAKGIGSVAAQGDNPEAQWDDFIGRVQGDMVQPYYAANLSGGGWPEGWNYGPLATLNMTWTVLAVKTATGIDLVNDPSAPFVYPVNAPTMLQYSAWPSLRSLEDSSWVYNADNPTPTSRWLFTAEAGLAKRLGGDPSGSFQDFVTDIRSVSRVDPAEADLQRWIDFLFWEGPTAGDYTKSPLSYEASGMDMGIVRSSWAKNAVWGSFKGGPYVACPCSGEEYPDKGNVAIVNGARPFLVNTGGALQRNTPGADDGGQYFDLIYNELFGDTGNREIFNLFYVSEPKPAGQGEYLRNDGARTSMVAFDDGGDYVFMSSSHLEDEYPQRRDSNPQTVTSWTRDVIYVRPDIFVVDDATEITDPSIDQWLAWHFTTQPTASGSTGTRFDIGSGSAYAGTIDSVFPTGSKTRVVNVFDSDKVYRVEIRPGASGAGQRWLTVFDAASSPSEALDATAMSSAAGNITAGAATGVLLVGTGRNVVYVKVDQPGSGVTYRAPVGSTLNVVSGLDPSGSYSVVVSSGSGATTVSITPSGDRHPSNAGVLSFST